MAEFKPIDDVIIIVRVVAPLQDFARQLVRVMVPLLVDSGLLLDCEGSSYRQRNENQEENYRCG